LSTGVHQFHGTEERDAFSFVTDGFACFLLATFLAYNVTWGGVEPLQQVMSGF